VPHIEKFSEKDNARQGFFEPDELERMLAFLPDYLKDITRLSYQVAQRRDPYLRHGAEIMSCFIAACILAPAPQHFSGRITHSLKHLSA
jgi:hypothetical protein